METEEGVPLRRRAAAAGIAACVSAVVVNPLDVVKTRIQAQGFRHAAAVPATDARAGFSGRAHASAPQFRANSRALAVAGCPPTCPTTGNPHVPRRLCAPECATYTSSFDVLRKIVRQEGARALFRGTSAALLVAVPTVGIYLPLYDYGNDYLKRKLGASRDLERLASRARDRRRGDESRVRRAVRRAVGPGADPRAGESKRLSGARTGDRSGVWTSLSDAARWREKRGREERRRRRERRADPDLFSEVSGGAPTRRARASALDRRRSDVGAGRAVFRAVLVRGGALAADGDGRRRALENRNAVSETVRSRRRGANRVFDASLTKTESLCAHFFSGAVAGGAVAALTTPLDVVKTRVQIRDAPSLLDFAGGMSKTVGGLERAANNSGAATTHAETFARGGGDREASASSASFRRWRGRGG